MPPQICKDKSGDHIINDFQEKFHKIRKDHTNRLEQIDFDINVLKNQIQCILCKPGRTQMDYYDVNLVNYLSTLIGFRNNLALIGTKQLEALLKQYDQQGQYHIMQTVNPYKHFQMIRNQSVRDVLFSIIY
jgi:hypothetical protein